MALHAFAKVNLGLAVVARRADGFHDIDTVFQTVSIADSVRISGPRDEVSIDVRPARVGRSVETAGASLGGRHGGRDEERCVPADETNLAVRAALELSARTGCPGVAIELTKRVPVAAGLGGGSSDAAAVLVGMKALYSLELSDRELRDAALEIGSDVPFFIGGGTARGRGRGERLDALAPLVAWLVLATPDAGITAGDGYARARIGLTRSAELIRLSCSAIQEGDLEALGASLVNDLEAGVVSCCPDVAAARSVLERAGALGVVMSGSGPTVLGLARGEGHAIHMASRLEGCGLQIAVVRTTGEGSRIAGSGTA
jgi:4-diphosphocytidyl-2-C-methyl-D-erythritol kinase